MEKTQVEGPPVQLRLVHRFILGLCFMKTSMTMVLILDGSSEYGAQAWFELGNSICLRYFKVFRTCNYLL